MKGTERMRAYLGRYSVLHTSGTFGKPLYMIRDDHRNKIQGQLIAQRLLKGLDLSIMDHRKHRIAAVIYAVNGSSSYEGFLRQQRSIKGYEGNLLAIDVREDPDEIIAKLNEFQPEMLTGYGSVLLLLAQAKKSGKLDIPVKIIANSAEALSPERHVYVEEAFGCPVKNNYCMTEGGEIAMTQDGADLLLNEDFIIVEMSDEEGKPLTDRSQWSQGILVTDLTNYVQPVIRYHVNDVVRIEETPDDQIRLPRLWIRGRANEVFDYCGKSFTTSGIASASEFHESVLDFQFVQRSENELSIRGIADALHNKEQVFSSLAEIVENYFREHGADSARVSWSDEALIRKERGGKAPRYVDLRT